MNSSHSQFASHFPPKNCAFHPSETIFNFCTNQECLLPLCPTCIDLHTQEHKNQKTYGKLENLTSLVHQLLTKFDGNLSKLAAYRQEIDQQLELKSNDEGIVRQKVQEAKERIINLVERFFQDFQKEIEKSIKQFNASMKESYRNMNNQIQSMEKEINNKISNLSSEKILKTVIAYYAKDEEKKIQNNLQVLGDTLELCGLKRASLVTENSAINRMVSELSQHMYLSFENWENQVKYHSNQFVKTGFSHRTNSSRPFSDEANLSHRSSTHSRNNSKTFRV